MRNGSGPAPERTIAETDVAIIGGGLLGCGLAFRLANAGVDAILLERDELNREASGTNAGSLHIQLLRPPGMEDAWLERFKPLVGLHAEAARAWRRLEGELGLRVGVRMHGGLFVAETDAQLAMLGKKVAIERDGGLDTSLVSGAEARAMCPVLSPSVIGADYCADDGVANSLLVAPALARRATECGARVLTRHEVQAIDVLGERDFRLRTAGGDVRAHRVVAAAGPWTARVAAMVGVGLPIGPNILGMHVTEAQPRELDLLIQHAGQRLTLKQTEHGTYIIGGGWPGEYVAQENRKGTSFDSLAGNLWIAAQVVPRLARLRVIRTWAGLGSNTPDWRPIIGECRGVPGFHVLFAGLGFTLGLACARMMADVLTRPAPSGAVDAFAPASHAGAPTP